MTSRKIIVEGSVIVVSILLAFGIDAMWDEHKERREEREILASLKTEFQVSLDQIESVYRLHSTASQTMEEMFSATDEEIRALDQTRRSEYVRDMCNPWSFYPVIGTTHALIGAGDLDILESRELRGALTEFLTLVEDSIEDIVYVGHDAERVWVVETEIGGPWADADTDTGATGNALVAPNFIPRPTVDDIIRIRQNSRLMGLIGRCHINIGFYKLELDLLRAGATRVLELIAESE